ncbi:SDR family NAD(P)-dependent oxidoreductase [Actinomadura luteofluorescens]|uniref:SDR family NAD(P)-dependent oxidoreductase n=1 Tax=Actinomadura luteofluorescens TaxID=46163 RepID=UPI003629B4B1
MQNTVAVTGADGFIGSHLVEALVERGHRVRAMVQYNSFASWGWLDDVAPGVLEQVDVVPGDVRDPASVRGLVRGAEAVYHLAALIAIPYSYRAPRSYVDTNVTGTLNVLEAVRDEETPRLVHTSTSETYGTARRVPIDEAHPLQAQSPYAATKIAADKLVESYHASFGLPAVTLRPFNTFGPRQSARAFIPTVVAQIAAGTGSRRGRGARTDPRLHLRPRHRRGVRRARHGARRGRRRRHVQLRHRRGDLHGRLARTIAGLMGADPEFRCAADRERPAASEVMRLVCDSG